MHATVGLIAIEAQAALCYDSLLLPTCVLVLHIALCTRGPTASTSV